LTFASTAVVPSPPVGRRRSAPRARDTSRALTHVRTPLARQTLGEARLPNPPVRSPVPRQREQSRFCARHGTLQVPRRRRRPHTRAESKYHHRRRHATLFSVVGRQRTRQFGTSFALPSALPPNSFLRVRRSPPPVHTPLVHPNPNCPHRGGAVLTAGRFSLVVRVARCSVLCRSVRNRDCFTGRHTCSIHRHRRKKTKAKETQGKLRGCASDKNEMETVLAASARLQAGAQTPCVR